MPSVRDTYSLITLRLRRLLVCAEFKQNLHPLWFTGMRPAYTSPVGGAGFDPLD